MITIYFVADDDHAAAGTLAQGPQGEETVESEVDPTALAGLHAAITGADLDALLADDNYPRLVAESPAGPYVAALAPEFTARLAEIEVDDHLEAWLSDDDLAGADPDQMSDFLTDLTTLARDATTSGTGVYCWVGV